MCRRNLQLVAVYIAAVARCAAVEVPPALTGPSLTNLTRGGWWDADLGIPLNLPSGATWILLGDVESLAPISRTPNAIGLLQGEGQALSVRWQEQSNRLAAPFFPLLGESTVPAGAIALSTGDVWVFCMNVSWWPTGPGQDQAANGMVVHGTVDPSTGVPVFDRMPTWAAPNNSVLVNAAPIAGQADEDKGWVYVFATGQYRATPVFLARVQEGMVGSLSAYQWWNGSLNGTGCDNSCWGPYESARPTLAGPLLSWVGELHVTWDPQLQQYILCAMDYNPQHFPKTPGLPWFICSSAPHPVGPWSTPTIVWDSWPQPWWQAEWGQPYGGYILGAQGGVGTVLLSLFKPYRVFAVPNVQLVGSSTVIAA